MKEHEQAVKNRSESKPNAKDDLKSLPMPEAERDQRSKPE
jgi:hypothetical protein